MKNRNVNWRGMQAAGCLKLDSFKKPSDVNVKHMTGGTWHANLHKEGKRHGK